MIAKKPTKKTTTANSVQPKVGATNEPIVYGFYLNFSWHTIGRSKKITFGYTHNVSGKSTRSDNKIIETKDENCLYPF